MFMEMVTNASIVALLAILVPVGVVAVAVTYAIRPTERRLALMRPLSLAAIFSGLGSFTLGVMQVLRGVAAAPLETNPGWRGASVGLAEAFVALFIAFGCLTIAWLLIALGLRRADVPR